MGALASQVALVVKNPPANACKQGWVQSPSLNLHFLTILLYMQRNTHELGDTRPKRMGVGKEVMQWLSPIEREQKDF